MVGEAQVRVGGSLNIVVRGGGKAARAIALRAARGTLARNPAFAYVVGEDGALRCEQRAAFRATPQQLREMAERNVSRARRAVITALRAAGYQVDGPGPVTIRIDAAGGIFVSGGGDDARAIALHAARVTLLGVDRRFDFVAGEDEAIRCRPASKRSTVKASTTKATSTKAPAAVVRKGQEAALRALRAAGHRIVAPPVVRVRVDKTHRIVISGGDDDARSVAVEAAQAARPPSRKLSFVADAGGAILCRSVVAFRATPEQIARMVQGRVESGRKAAVKALRKAGYRVMGPGAA
ncbi:Hypothetical protein A7982_05786 [Minicystis rosea]|nr:Hypothetical protein A7982_05786 [Minicystis rosea]